MINNTLASLLEQHDKWLITTHKGPDGDAIGSVVAWAEYARQNKKEYLILLADQPPSFLLPFLSDYHWEVYVPNTDYIYELIFALDYNAPQRVGEQMSNFIEHTSGVKIMIDHHPDPINFCQIMISDVDACSTTEVIYKTLDSLDKLGKINEAMAKGLYLGLVTDTGSFRYSSVSAFTHQMVAKLFLTGFKHELIHQAVFDNNSISRLQLRGFALSQKLKLFPQYGIGLISLSRGELQQFDYQKGDTEGLVNEILSIKGYTIGIFLMEIEDGVKLSFRSKGERYVNEFAKIYFNGGGHKNAAGGFYADSLSSVLTRLEGLLNKL